MHAKEKYSHQAHIITETITNWQPHKMLKITAPTLKLKAYQSGMKKARACIKVESDAPNVNF